MRLVTDTGIVLVRELRPTWRDPFSVLFSIVQPLIFLGLFGPLLAGTSDVPGDSLWQWFVPGILVMVALFGTSMTGSNLLYEMQTGSHERMTVTPLSRPALLIGRALKEMVPLVVQAVLIVAVVLPFGFRLYPLGALVGLLILAVLGVGLGALSYALALAVRNQEWMFWMVQQTVVFPLLILSGMLLPLDRAPGWMVVASHVNPLTYVIEAERALFAGDFGAAAVWQGAVAALVAAVVGLLVGTRMMNRATS
ncbi:MAG: ABC transporter permease [Streptosporangiales bacterium]|nr:ABC transporter permease [Streptosporangiales bacterium]